MTAEEIITGFIACLDFHMASTASIHQAARVLVLGQFSDSTKKMGLKCRKIQFNPCIAAWFSAIT
jgi:hypothetical protein